MTHTALSFAATLAALSTVNTAFAGPEIDAYYRGDILHNSSGGIRTGSAYLDDAGLMIGAEVGSLFGADDANFFVYLLYNNGSSFSNVYSGDAQGVSNIDAPEATRIYELWYEQSWSDQYSLRVGLYDLNSEFDSIDSAGLFMNSSHGIGPDYSQSGRAGPSIFPVTSMAARFDWAVSESGTLRYALLDGVPGDPNDPSRTTIRFGKGDGVLHALEYNRVLATGARLGMGGWLYSANFDRIEGQDINGDPLRDNGNGGLYGFVDMPVLSADKSGIEMTAFLRYGIANDKLNALDSYIGGGLVMSDLVDSRPDDQLGIAFSSARVGDPFKRATAGVKNSETKIELTYSAQINDWLRLQPDIQYVVNPGFDPSLKNALVLGLQFELFVSRESW